MEQSSSSGGLPQNTTRGSRKWKLVREAVSRLANASRDGEAGGNPRESSEIRTPLSEHLSQDLRKAFEFLAFHTDDDRGDVMRSIMDKGHNPTMREIKIFEDIFNEYKKTYPIDELVKIQQRSTTNSNNIDTSQWERHFAMYNRLKDFFNAPLEGSTIEDISESQVPNEENPMEGHIPGNSSLYKIIENAHFDSFGWDELMVGLGLSMLRSSGREKLVKFVNEVVNELQIHRTGCNFEAIKLWWAGIIFEEGSLMGEPFHPSNMKYFGTALHWAIELEDKTIVDAILASGGADINEASYWMKGTPLHMVVLKGDLDIVRQLLGCKEKIRLTEADIAHRTPVEIAHTMRFIDIERALMECEAVRSYVDALYKNRQVYVDAANAILVGAALIASVTFASWLQPPLGYTIEDHVNVEDNGGLLAFWVFNSLSFYFAMGTVVFGARSVLPRQNVFIRTIVEKLRINLLVTSILLGCSVFFVIIAFGIAGCIVLTPTLKVQWTMIAPTIVGGFICIISLGLLFRNIWDERKGARSGNTEIQYLLPNMTKKKPSLIQRMMFRMIDRMNPRLRRMVFRIIPRLENLYLIFELDQMLDLN